MDLGELNPVCRTPPVGSPSFDLESLDAAEMQIFLMAVTPGQVVDSGTATTTSMGKQLLLCSLREKSGDRTSLVLRMPLLPPCLAACGFMELLFQSTPGKLGG